MTSQNIERLKALFPDKKQLWNILELASYESNKMIDYLKNSGELFASPVNLYMTGRTGSGKTTIGILLSDKNQPAMSSTGYMNCTKYLGVLQTKSLNYYDTPGPCSDDDYENINRAIFSMPQLED